MPNAITTTADSLWTGVVSGFTSFMMFIPALLGAAVVLLVGWFLSSIVAKLVEKLLHAVKLEHAVARSGVSSYFPIGPESNLTVSGIVATLAKWFIRLIFIQAAANILGMPQITQIINSILLFLPNLAIALLILVVGAMLARYVGALVEGSVTRMQVGRPNLFAMIARYAILGFAVIAAVNQIGIATNLINILFTGLVASLALGLGLAFGLGGQGVAGEITRNWYDTGRNQANRLRAVNGGSIPNNNPSNPPNQRSI